MIGVKEALQRIKTKVQVLPAHEVYLKEALGCVLSSDVLAPVTFPPFDQSAMDGYAIKGVEFDEFNLIGEIKAGDDATDVQLQVGQAIRIFTGAMVPDSSDAVVKQEDVEVLNLGMIRIDKQISPNENIRLEGEQIAKGQMVAKKGIKVNTGLIAYCAMLGIEKLKIYRKPEICLITTGNELVQPGQKLNPGQIYDSNSIMLETALKELGFSVESFRASDDLDSTKRAVKQALDNFDLILLTGGISVGDYDFVHEALSSNGVEEVFYKVKQKPGKPLYMGLKGDKTVFGLPGNPASVFTCLHVYVIEAIRIMMGIESRKKEYALLKEMIQKPGGKTQFLKARETDGEVEILKRQSSAMLGDFIEANCFVVFEEEDEVQEDQRVEIIRLPKPFLF